MIIEPRVIIDVARELIKALNVNSAELHQFTEQLKSLEVKQDALDLEVRSLTPPKEDANAPS